MPWHSGRVLEEDETSQCRVPCFRGFRSRFVKETVSVMTKRMWEGRREGFKVNSTMEESQGPGRPSTRGRFSESWKRLSSRHGSTKRLASQQAAVRSRTASVCAPFFPVCWIWSKGVGCQGGTAAGREKVQRTRAWDHTEMERGGCRKESGLSRWESKGPLLPQRMSVESFSTCSTLWPLKGFMMMNDAFICTEQKQEWDKIGRVSVRSFYCLDMYHNQVFWKTLLLLSDIKCFVTPYYRILCA